MRLLADLRRCFSPLAGVLLLFGIVTGQAAGQGVPPPLAITTESLPDALSHQRYLAKLEARGGVAPYHWSLQTGEVPPGLELDETGNISGTPIQSGEFRFTVAASDSEVPARKVSRDFTLRVISPLELAWGNFPGVEGNVIKGSVKVSNASKDDFDLTVIVVAVNEIGKAFALGYQRFSLKQAVADFEIPFSSSLPQGSYVVHADAVAEIPAKDAIYRRRLQTPSPLAITTGP